MELTLDQALQKGIEAHKAGQVQEAERLYRGILKALPTHPDANHNLGVIAVSVGKTDLALPFFKTALEANPKVEQFWLSYVDALIKGNQFETVKNVLAEGRKVGLIGGNVDALEAQLTQITKSALPKLSEKRKSLTLKEKRRSISESKQQKKQGKSKRANNVSPSQQQTSRLLEHYQSGQYDKAEKLAVLITQQFPEHQFGWKVLGAVFGQTGRVPESLDAKQKTVRLAPQDADAHYNLGKTLQELNRLEEAEASNRQAILLQPDLAQAHSNLGVVLYCNGDKESALESIGKANDIDPTSKEFRLLLSVMKSRRSREKSEIRVSDKDAFTALASNPLILHRTVEAELISTLYEMNAIELDKTRKHNDARFGNGRCSPDFNLFEDTRSAINVVAEDLRSIMMEAVKSEIFIYGSFFNILGAGGGSVPHDHLSAIDEVKGLSLTKQKYSLVYYLSEGDQNCSEPGTLKLYDPSKDILPCEGMITIIPASRKHSAIYGGKKDRIMIGVNFYSL